MATAKATHNNDHSKDHGHGFGSGRDHAHCHGHGRDNIHGCSQRRNHGLSSGVSRSANQQPAAPATAASLRSSGSALLRSEQSIATKDHCNKKELTVHARLRQPVPWRPENGADKDGVRARQRKNKKKQNLPLTTHALAVARSSAHGAISSRAHPPPVAPPPRQRSRENPLKPRATSSKGRSPTARPRRRPP